MSSLETKLRHFEMFLRGESPRLELNGSVYSPESLKASEHAFGELLSIWRVEDETPRVGSLIFEVMPRQQTNPDGGVLIGSFLNYLIEEELKGRMRSQLG